MRFIALFAAFLFSQASFGYDFSGKYKVVETKCFDPQGAAASTIKDACKKIRVPTQLEIIEVGPNEFKLQFDKMGYFGNASTDYILMAAKAFSYDSAHERSEVAVVVSQTTSWGSFLEYRNETISDGYAPFGPARDENTIKFTKIDGIDRIYWHVRNTTNSRGSEEEYGTLLLNYNFEFKIERE